MNGTISMLTLQVTIFRRTLQSAVILMKVITVRLVKGYRWVSINTLKASRYLGRGAERFTNKQTGGGSKKVSSFAYTPLKIEK